MDIKLSSERNMTLDLEKESSILLVGIYGTGKTRTIKEILRHAKAEYDDLDVLYVDEHTADFDTVKDITGYLLNDSANMTESELKSLYEVVKAQQEFRNHLICDAGVHTLAELVGKEVTTFVIGDREYMPDDIICYYENGKQRWLLIHEWYKRKVKAANSYFGYSQIMSRIGKYNPTRLMLCFDEFYTLNMSKEGQKLVHDIALSIIHFGRVVCQNVILTTQRVERHKEYGDVYKLASVKVFFHSGFDNADDFKVLFNKELPVNAGRGDVTFATPYYTSIDNGVVSELWESMDEVLVEHELEDFSLSEIKMLSQILKRKVVYLDKMFERRLLHIIEVTRELDFSGCKDVNISWHIVGQDVNVSVLTYQLPSDYVISAKMLNMSDEDLIKNKELCKYIG
jgi:hypothetical protein